MRAILFTSLLILGCGHNSANNTDASTDGTTDDVPTDTGPPNVSVTITNRPNNPAMFNFLVAYQDGGGVWTVAPPPNGDTYTFQINSDRWGVGWTCIRQNIHEVWLDYFTTQERTSLTIGNLPLRCSDRIPSATVSGTVTNRGNGGESLTVAVGDVVANVEPNTGQYTLQTPPGTYDLIVARAPIAVGDNLPSATSVRRALVVAGNTTVNVDFAATSAATQRFAVTGIPTGGAGSTATVTTVLFATNATDPDLSRDSTTPYESISLPTGQMVGTDLYDQRIVVTAPGGRSVTTHATATPTALAYVAPALLGTINSMVASTTPYPILRTSWTAYPNAVGYVWSGSQQQNATQCGSTANCAVLWTVGASTGWVAAAASYQMPDLSALAGWTPLFQYVTGTQVAITLSAVTSTAGVGDFPNPKPAAGTDRTVVSRNAPVTP